MEKQGITNIDWEKFFLAILNPSQHTIGKLRHEQKKCISNSGMFIHRFLGTLVLGALEDQGIEYYKRQFFQRDTTSFENALYHIVQDVHDECLDDYKKNDLKADAENLLRLAKEQLSKENL